MIRARHGSGTLCLAAALSILNGRSAAAAAVSRAKVLAQITAAPAGRATIFPTFPRAAGWDDRPAGRSLAPSLVVVRDGGGGGRRRSHPVERDLGRRGHRRRDRPRPGHQLFENAGRSPVEAVYVFPASPRAAVHDVRMTIGARVIEAKMPAPGPEPSTSPSGSPAPEAAPLIG